MSLLVEDLSDRIVIAVHLTAKDVAINKGFLNVSHLKLSVWTTEITRS